jgi:hypothetical protein
VLTKDLPLVVGWHVSHNVQHVGSCVDLVLDGLQVVGRQRSLHSSRVATLDFGHVDDWAEFVSVSILAGCYGQPSRRLEARAVSALSPASLPWGGGSMLLERVSRFEWSGGFDAEKKATWFGRVRRAAVGRPRMRSAVRDLAVVRAVRMLEELHAASATRNRGLPRHSIVGVAAFWSLLEI